MSRSSFRRRLLPRAAPAFVLLAACSSSESPRPTPVFDGGTGGHVQAGSGGAPSTGGALPGGAGGLSSGGNAPEGGGDGSSGGAPTDGGHPPLDSGTDGGRTPLSRIVEEGTHVEVTAPRPEYGAVLAAASGNRSYVVEARRDVESGPFGLPWRSRFRLAAYDGASLAWAHDVPPDDLIADVAVHPSGAVTLSVQRHPKDRLSYDLVRLTKDGDVVGTTTLDEPATLPGTDFAPADPRPLFRMKSYFPDALTAGWVRLLPDGEGLVVAFLSYVDAPGTSPLSAWYALGVEAMDFDGASYVERWARVVDGPHDADPAAWAYDELRQRDQAVRPFLARDPIAGEIVVARTFNRLRCEANVNTFGEFVTADCTQRAVNPAENERLPLVVTRFAEDGRRIGSLVIPVDEDAAEQVPFDLEAQGGRFAVAGTVVRTRPDGSKRTYPDENGFVDYDGYVAIYDRTGARVGKADFDGSRGDVLAALEWTSDGIIAAGSAGWDRWQGGMSISRGANPFFAWLSEDTSQAKQRIVEMSGGSRHFNLHDVHAQGGTIVGYGISDAPMTHSADGNQNAERTFGPLRVTLAPR